MTRDVLPARPLGLRASAYLRRGCGLAVLVAITAGLALGSVWAGSEAVAIRRDAAVWSGGVPATAVAVNGRVEERGLGWVLSTYDLEVTYETPSGRHRGGVDVTTLFGELDTGGAPALRYDPDRPERFALGWVVDGSGARWRWAVIGGLVFAAMSALFGWVTVAFARDLAALRRCARDGDEIVVDVSAVVEVKRADGAPTSKRRYHLVSRDEPPRRWSEELDLLKTRPLFADAAEQTAFALRLGGERGLAILLRADLYPLAIGRAEAAEVGGRAAGAIT
jgi:hypothetical protein